MKKLSQFIVLLTIIAFTSCIEDDAIISSYGEVEIYLLDDYNSDELSGVINESGVKIKETPLIKYYDIISYNAKAHTFKVKDSAIEAIEDLEYSGFRMAFGVVANKQLIYTGYFWTGLSSSICNWTIIDVVLMEETNELNVQLGYPYLMEGMNIPDKRNHDQILNIFRGSGKLIE